jgi:hypothetical protein|tara:strand:+ start:2322 stop:2474 length:153 start_codon:yes stop_codon:yes gene_type:complete
MKKAIIDDKNTSPIPLIKLGVDNPPMRVPGITIRRQGTITIKIIVINMSP